MTIEKQEGSFIELLKKYLDSKKFDQSLYKSIEPKRLVIGTRDNEIGIKEIECRMSMSFYEDNELETTASIRNIAGRTKSKKLRLSTRKESLDLNISTGIEGFEGGPGTRTFVGDGNLDVRFKNYLTKFPEQSETYDIECVCDNKKLKCEGKIT